MCASKADQLCLSLKSHPKTAGLLAPAGDHLGPIPYPTGNLWGGQFHAGKGSCWLPHWDVCQTPTSAFPTGLFFPRQTP